MLENFNITSLVLKRHVKISVYLPKHYNENNNPYNSIFLLDGQNIFFDNYADNGVSMKLANTLDENNAGFIKWVGNYSLFFFFFLEEFV